MDVAGQEPRIGVFVCQLRHQHRRRGGRARRWRNTPRTLPHVAYVEDNLFTCSQDTQEKMKQPSGKRTSTAIVVASCTPRTHEPLFQETIRDAGLNKYLFEMANIRDQSSWVHSGDPEAATAKAKDLVRMAVAEVALQEPLDRFA